MLNMIFVRSLNSHLSPSSKIVVCGINPGFCHSSIRRNIKFPMTILIKLMEITIARETDEGAKTLVHAGTNGLPDDKKSEREAMRGAYMSDCRPEEPSDFLLSETGKTFEGKVWVSTGLFNDRLFLTIDDTRVG
jgi:retinol dehydrogenase-12